MQPESMTQPESPALASGMAMLQVYERLLTPAAVYRRAKAMSRGSPTVTAGEGSVA